MMVLTLKESEMKLKTPFRMVISGPSGSGKTTFCYDLIKAQSYMLEVPVRRIIYFYMDMNPVIARIAKLEFVEVVKGFNYDLVEDHDGGPEGLWILIDDHICRGVFQGRMPSASDNGAQPSLSGWFHRQPQEVVPDSGSTFPVPGFQLGHGLRLDVDQRRQTPEPFNARLKDGS